MALFVSFNGSRMPVKSMMTFERRKEKKNTFLLTLLLFVLTGDWFEMEVSCIQNAALGFFYVLFAMTQNTMFASHRLHDSEHRNINFVFFCIFFVFFFSFHYFPFLIIIFVRSASADLWIFISSTDVTFCVLVLCLCRAKFITRTNARMEKKWQKNLLRQERISYSLLRIFFPFPFIILIKPFLFSRRRLPLLFQISVHILFPFLWRIFIFFDSELCKSATT